MKISVSFEVEADLDGWAKTSGTNAGIALIAIQNYLRSLNPVQGQTFLELASPVRAVVDLDQQ